LNALSRTAADPSQTFTDEITAEIPFLRPCGRCRADHCDQRGQPASLQADDGYCKVREIVPGGPAARSGQLKVGDRIAGVAQSEGDFTDLVDMPLPQAVEFIRGKKGTTVRLTIIPAAAANDAASKTVSIVRDEIKLEDQQAKARVVDLPGANCGTQRVQDNDQQVLPSERQVDAA